ncbi:nitronate monooxygenase, partial [candidate division KSB1 bacterium]|nr:nitronate monooxygenase [candidate division KSB1 bacterium]
LAVVIDKQAPFVIFAGSIPRGSEIKSAKASGAKVLAFASSESIAERMIAQGVDALILEGSEAGGHIGQVSLVILLQQVLFQFNQVPIFVAGGIGTGRLIAHLLLMGAAGIQMGTRFVLTHECEVHPQFKAAFVKARARDAIASPAVTSELHVVAVRAIRNRNTDEFANLQIQLLQQIRRGEISQSAAQFEVEKFWVGALRQAVQAGDVEHGSLMAGQSVGLVNKIQSLPELFSEIITAAEAELQRVQQILAG